jgi:hypothetical protein
MVFVGGSLFHKTVNIMDYTASNGRKVVDVETEMVSKEAVIT